MRLRLGFCFERGGCDVLKREIISLIYKYVTHFRTYDKKNRDDLTTPYTMVDYVNHDDIQGQAYFVIKKIFGARIQTLSL